jgi:hypothetical protein
MQDLKSERRWLVRQVIIAVNLLLLGITFFADYNGLKLVTFLTAVNGFQIASAGWFIADYATKPKE